MGHNKFYSPSHSWKDWLGQGSRGGDFVRYQSAMVLWQEQDCSHQQGHKNVKLTAYLLLLPRVRMSVPLPPRAQRAYRGVHQALGQVCFHRQAKVLLRKRGANNTKLRLFRCIILVSYWYHTRIILVSYWYHTGIILVSVWRELKEQQWIFNPQATNVIYIWSTYS